MTVITGPATRARARRSGNGPKRMPARASLLPALAGLATLALATAAFAETPRSSLRLEAGDAGDTLTVIAGQPVRMHLSLPGKEGWSQANVGHFVVRTYGKQESLSPVPAAGTDYVEYTFDEPGLALIILAVGPASEKGKSDSWQRTTHCTRLIVRVVPDVDAPQDYAALMPDPGLTAKIGDRIEVRPLIAPSSLRVGHHLPVRIYFGGSKQTHVTVAAHRGDRAIETKSTDSVGTTFFSITEPGRWLIRYEESVEGTTYTGDLVFDVPEENGEKGGGE